MQKELVIVYYQKINDNEIKFLGKETFVNIEEALIPDVISRANIRFIHKKFFNNDNYQWLLDSLVHPPLPHCPDHSPIYNVILKKYSVSIPEVYLSQTLKKNRKSLSSLLYKFTLVEVDFGFTQSISKYKVHSKTPKRYPSFLQLKEMRKRRLAIVLQTFGNDLVQVVPLTSKAPYGNKNAFKLNSKSLEPFDFYGSSGKESWALCDMIQTVSITRINPGITIFKEKSGYERKQRNENYPYRLCTEDRDQLSSILLDCYSPDDYLELKRIRLKYFALQSIQKENELEISNLKIKLSRLESMCQAYGLDLDTEGF